MSLPRGLSHRLTDMKKNETVPPQVLHIKASAMTEQRGSVSLVTQIHKRGLGSGSVQPEGGDRCCYFRDEAC